jgi:hypothetical protein
MECKCQRQTQINGNRSAEKWKLTKIMDTESDVYRSQQPLHSRSYFRFLPTVSPMFDVIPNKRFTIKYSFKDLSGCVQLA